MRICPSCDKEFPVTRRVCPDDGDVLLDSGEPGVHTGQVLGERYEVGNLLGDGGMGFVYEARCQETGDTVALKVLKAEAFTENSLKRLEGEARAAAKIGHPGIVQIRDCQIGERLAFLVMEKLRGHTLDVLRRAGKLDTQRAVEILSEVSEIVGVAHEHNVIHRDLKPTNIMLHRPDRDTEQVKVLDFGIAKICDMHMTPLTPSGQFIGTPTYTAPEQAGQGMSYAASDVYSLGVLLFEAISGRLPFRSGHLMEHLRKLLSEPAPPLSAFKSDIPEELDAIVERCLRKQAETRFRTASDLAAALRSVSIDDLQSRETSAPRPRPGARVGTSLDDRYQLEEWLGPGRFGSQVYRAIHLNAQREVAVRLWEPRDPATKEALVQAVRGEARAMGVSHSHVITVFDVVIGDETIYTITEYIESISLRALIEREKAFRPERVIELFTPLISAMAELHKRNVVSGGLTPETIRVSGADGQESLSLSPFGLSDSQQVDDLLRQESEDAPASFLDYLAPEQREGSLADKRSDVYTLTLILLETFRGEASDDALTMPEVSLAAHGSEAAELGLDSRWQRFLSAGLAEDPAERFQDAGEMLTQIPK
ncbi:MAG: serine/threonine-protein kinase [Planctomycetota bacterium]